MREPIRLRYIHHFKGLTYPSRWEPRLMAVKDPDTEIDVDREGGNDAFVEFVEQTYETELTGVQFARDARREEELGRYDAFCNACGAEPGVKAARELCDTLVMGPACASMHVASMLGRRFSYLIAGGDDGGHTDHARENITGLAERYGLAHKLASVRTIGVTPRGFREDLISADELATLKEATLTAALAAVYEDAADVLVGYGGPELYDFLVEELRPLGVPVISPDLALLKVTEMLVRLGLSQSKRTHPTPRQFYDFDIAPRAVVRADSSTAS